MKHWETALLMPGFYSVTYGSSDGVRQAAVPITAAAEHVARDHEPKAEMFPVADQGDFTPQSVVLIDGISELDGLELQAEEINAQLDESAELGCELVLA